MGGLTIQQSHHVVVDLHVNRIETLGTLKTAGPIVEALARVRPKLAIALAAAALQDESDPVRRLALRQNEVGSALSQILRGLAADMFAPDEVREAARRLDAAMLGGRLGLRISHRDRVGIAEDAHEQRVLAAPLLAVLPPAVSRMVDAWVEAGDVMGSAMLERFPLSDGPAETTVELLQEVKTILSRLRAAIRHELTLFDDLPANLEEQLLGPADQLSRRTRQAKPKAVETEVIDSDPSDSIPEPAVAPQPAPGVVPHGPEAHTDHA